MSYFFHLLSLAPFHIKGEVFFSMSTRIEMAGIRNGAPLIFLPHSLLGVYVQVRRGRQRRSERVCISDILTIIRDDVRENKMYDPTNPDIIILSGNAKEVLQARYLHKTELPCLIMEQMSISMARQRSHHIQTPSAIRAEVLQVLEEVDRHVELIASEAPPPGKTIFQFSTQVESYSTSSFSITLALRRVLRTLPDHHERELYTYIELYNSVSMYITTNSQLIDEQNHEIIKCKHDRLGEAFLVDTFHKCQLKILITAQLVAEVTR